MASFLCGIGRMRENTALSLFLLALSVGLLIAGVLLLPRSHSRAISTLAQWNDVRVIGPLIDALPMSLGRDRYEILRLLTDLLHRVKAEDYPLLTWQQQRKLMDSLYFSENHQEVHFQVAVVRSLARVGDADALRLLQSLASDAPLSDYEHMVRDAARDCLPLLQDRLERLRQSQHLLRPSVSEPLPDELLRPVTSREDADPEILLRPTQE